MVLKKQRKTFNHLNPLGIFNDVNAGPVEDLVVDQLVADDVLLDQRLRRRRVHVAVDHRGHARHDDLNGRLRVAQAHAARLADEDVRESLLVDRVHERRERVLRAGGDAARAHAHDHLHVLVGRVAHFHRLLLLLALWFAWKDKLENKNWFYIAALCCIPLVFLCGQCGWIVAEVGRQPWTIQGLLPVNVAISSLSAGAVKTTFFLFLAIFALFLVIEIRIMLGAIKKGPQITEG